MAKRLAVVGVVALALVLVAPVSGASVAGGIGQEQIDPDRVVLDVSLQPDGDAVWVVEYRVRLATDNETAAFEGIQSDIRENESRYTGTFGQRMERTAATAANATGREMSIRNVSVTAEQKALPQDYGVVTYRFRWTGFAAVDGDSVRAGDALAGFFLDNQTSLRISWPDGYAASEVAPEGDQSGDGEVVWRGPREFGQDEPTVVVVPEKRSTGVLGGFLGTGLGIGLALVVAAALLGAAFVARRRSRGLGDFLGASEPSESDADPVAGEDSGDDGESDGDDSPPAELLSNEERVLQLLESNDGRLKQQEVAERLDWTAAKTSQVVGDMREDDAVETFRLGRENVVTLPDRGLDEDLGPDDST